MIVQVTMVAHYFGRCEDEVLDVVCSPTTIDVPVCNPKSAIQTAPTVAAPTSGSVAHASEVGEAMRALAELRTSMAGIT